ncbi:hypothetical protein [Leptolyngbya iicbica]|uniref:Chromosome segregation ATPase n=2 Tax=Cyanophyceae TaxID=3028117 RepID=A0A4Q7EG60_9CYAN|nr:hypothetical protein [Leptolyngbya sp. LK]RZM81948.1 hypothetical protein DYY88_01355 [Leptolyngbya sp. LK]
MVSSSYSASEPVTPLTASAIASAPADLSGWQRFLQSQPLAVESDDLPDEADFADPVTLCPSESMGQLLVQTLGGLSGHWTLGLLAGTVAAGNLTLLAFDQLVGVPPAPDCTDLTSLDVARDQLTCWQGAIAAGDMQARQMAVAEVSRWPVSHPLFSEGQDLLEQWSRTALEAAQQAATAEDWATAIALVEQVSWQSPDFAAAQALKAQLHTQHQQLAQALDTQAQAALATADWATAYQSLAQLEQLDQMAGAAELSQQLAHQITVERETTRLWNEAQRLWHSGSVMERDAAIAIAHQIDPTTHRWQAVQPMVHRWSEEQITLAQTEVAPTVTPVSQPQLAASPYQPQFSGGYPVQY